MRSLRGTLLRGLLPPALVLLMLHGALLYRAVRYMVLREFDVSLESTAGSLATLVLEEGGELELDFADELMPDFESAAGGSYFQFWRQDGSVLERSRSLGATDLPRRSSERGSPVFWDVTLPGGRAGRAIGLLAHARPLDEHAPGPGVGGPAPVELVVARDRGDLDRFLLTLLAGTMTAGLMLAGALILAVRRAVRRSTARLDEVALAIAELAPGEEPPERLLVSTPLEVQPLLARLDDLLTRFRATLERERRTSADIAHQLRTPLAELRTAVDVALRWPEDLELTAQALADARDIGEQMERHATSLLQLARLQARHSDVRSESVDLDETAARAWASVSAAATRRGLVVESMPGAGTGRADAEALDIVLTNLAANAARHTPQGGRVRLRGRRVEDRAVLEIANTDPGLTDEHVRHLREPFWRRDRADRGGSGLGLSLCASLAEACGVDLSLGLEEGWFVARVSVPSIAS